jgi:hypothetical protein
MNPMANAKAIIQNSILRSIGDSMRIQPLLALANFNSICNVMNSAALSNRYAVHRS